MLILPFPFSSQTFQYTCRCCCDGIVKNIFCVISLKLLSWHGKRQDAANARWRAGSSHSLTQLTSLHFTELTHPFLHSLMHSLTQLTSLHSLTHSCFHSFNSLYTIHRLTHSPMPSLTNSLTHSLAQLTSLHFTSLHLLTCIH